MYARQRLFRTAFLPVVGTLRIPEAFLPVVGPQSLQVRVVEIAQSPSFPAERHVNNFKIKLGKPVIQFWYICVPPDVELHRQLPADACRERVELGLEGHDKECAVPALQIGSVRFCLKA